MSLVHIVLVRPRDGQESRADDLASRLAALAAELGAGDVYAGPDVSIEPFGGGYTTGLAIAFPGEHARDAYLRNPRHAELARELPAAADSVLVVDLPAAATGLASQGAQRT
ncbi:Dabb family protein [Actinomadura verrucosospora]